MYNTGWSFYLDNDAFSLFKVDQDYTGGFALTFSGTRATKYFFALDKVLDFLNKLIGFKKLSEPVGSFGLHSLEIGMTTFTPQDILDPEPIFDDHPYASLVFLANAKQRVIPNRTLTFGSAFTFGFLGTDLAEAIQKGIHKTLGQQMPQGWHNQISDGGEPTARYTLSLQKTHIWSETAEGPFELKSFSELNLGYTTDVTIGMNWRFGKIRTPWWSFNPHQAEYINLGAPIYAEMGGRKIGEFYIWAGTGLKYRIYNAILQGQFRESAVTFSRSDLNSWIGEVWLGITKRFSNGFEISFSLRGRTNEIKRLSSSNPVWGGIILRKIR
jgi:hypothetical protein